MNAMQGTEAKPDRPGDQIASNSAVTSQVPTMTTVAATMVATESARKEAGS